jgi:hypothetical protein
MSEYHYEKINLSDYNTSISDNINDNTKLNKKIKIKYIYIHYTNYPFYKKMSK